VQHESAKAAGMRHEQIVIFDQQAAAIEAVWSGGRRLCEYRLGKPHSRRSNRGALIGGRSPTRNQRSGATTDRGIFV
jgi:hypothetical protein